uniref:Integrin beta n=1 Tax=Poecilia mexicana TaxID=48701 RepID=A0A3B3XXK7_9TELE
MGSWSLRFLAGLGLLAVLLTCCSSQVNSCLEARSGTCSDCLQAGVGCAYCSEEVRDFGFPRCDLHEKILAHGCNVAYVIKATSKQTIERVPINTNLQRSQVSPQEVRMTFLPGETRELDVNVFAPTKGPLDLYILMDFSNSMKDDLDNLKKMGNKLATVVQEISSDYTIGFGKFVDKVIEPQTDMRPDKLKQPWPDSDSPFSFKNVIPLIKDVNSFTAKLQKERISGNLDAPEGGFDAILQAAVCKEIGWREGSTHLLVFSTESAFHYEADGANVLAGILPRNDEACHLDENGVYIQATKQDYPSIPTLVRVLGNHNIIPIFAVTNHSYMYYLKLKEYFPIAEIGVLQEDSSNILEIMRDAFVSIQSKMSIRADNRPKAFGAQFLDMSNKVVNYGAFNFKPGEIGKFKVKLTAQQMLGEQPVCKVDPGDKEGTIKVKPTTFDSAVNVKASILCETCDCEKTPTLKAKRCNGKGNLVCGKCLCDDGWAGAFCNCSKTSGSTKDQCIGPGMTESCSGRGDCQACGTCVCYNPDQYEGPYCQYDKTQCQRVAGILCNDRGSCVMGRCACSEGWEGTACECSKSNETCLDNKGKICGGQGKCVCGSCQCPDTGSGIALSPTCEPNFEFLRGVCEETRKCVQCKAWKTGEKKDEAKCKDCLVEVIMVDELKERGEVLDSCRFVDEDNDCTYEYTVETSKDPTNTKLLAEVLKKRDCPAASLLWLLPLILFLLLLLALLLLCCWKYCACCTSCWGGKYLYLLRQSQLTSNHLNTPMVRTGPPKGTDVVRWKVKDNVHRVPSHPRELMQPNPDEMIQFPISLRLNRLFSENLSRPESKDAEQLRQEVADNLNEVYKQIPEAQKVQQTLFRLQKNAGKRGNYTIMDTVLSAPRRAYPDIVKLTEKNVQSGNFGDLKVVPGYYTVATDREAAGAVEFQEEVEMVDVHVPLFVKDDDDDKKQLKVEARDVPLGIATIAKRFVNITIIKEHATSIFSFLQPKYTYSRKDGVAHIPISREIIEDGRTQVTYTTQDLSAKNKKDYMSVQGDLSYAPGETEKIVPVRLLELSEKDGFLEDKPIKQFVMDLSNPRQGAKLGRYPRTTVTIADTQEPSVMMFKKGNQNFSTLDQTYPIPVVRSRNEDSPATVKWRTKKSQCFDLSGSLKFAPGETEKNIVIEPFPGSAQPETFQLELYDPSTNAVVGERKNTVVNITEDQCFFFLGYVSPRGTTPGGRLLPPGNLKAKATGPRNIRLNWDPPPGNPVGYKVKYWIYGDPEKDAKVLDVRTPQAELTNLLPFCDYETRVCAYNSMGDGPDTNIVSCQTLEDAPGEPGRLAFNVISPTVTQLSWAEPAETNGDITAYEVIYTPIDDEMKPVGGAKKVKIDNPKKRMLLIENLQSAQTYQYKVRAQNSVGWGPFRDATINLASQPSRPMSIPIIPDVPIVDAEAGDEYDSYLMYSNDVLKSPTSSKTPSVSGDDYMSNGRWEQNFLFPGGSTTRNLSASSSPMSTLSSNYKGGAGGSFTTEMHTTYMTGPGKEDGRQLLALCFFYYFYSFFGLRHRNKQPGSEVFSHEPFCVRSDARLSPGVPDTPSRLVFSALGPTALKVSWQEPHCEKDVLGYCVLYQLLNGGETKRLNVTNPAENSVVIHDLLPNHSYLFKVKAQSQEGWGPEREGVITIESAVDPKSPLSPMPGSPFTLSTPSAPGPLVFTALSPDSLQLTWEKPRKPNGDILSYRVTCEQLHGGGDMRSFNVSGNNAETSLTVPNLTENVPYKFKVQAQTTQGFGPEREGIITIESQDGGALSQYNSQSVTRREVFQMSPEMTTRTNVSHTMINDPYFSDGMMMTQFTETGSMVSRQVTREVVQRNVTGASTVTKRMFYES